MSYAPPYYDKRSERYVVVERLSLSRYDHHKFADEHEAWIFSGHEREDQMSNDVTHLGAVGLDVIPMALSERACDLILDALRPLAIEGEDPEAQILAAKVSAELTIAREATLSKREQGGITDDVRKAAGMKVHEVSDEELAAASPEFRKHKESEAKRIAGKMAKAAKEAVEE